MLPWLLGGYTVLRWPWLRLRLVLQRLVLCALATAIALILIGRGLDLSADQVPLLNRELLLAFLLIQGAYALGLQLLYDDLPAWAPNPRGASWLLPSTTARSLLRIGEPPRSPQTT